MDVVGIEIDPALAVRVLEGVILPAVPQLPGEIDELARAGIAVGVAEAWVSAEALGGAVGERGDDVPADPSSAQMVERGEAAGKRIGLVEIGVHRRHQPDLRCDAGECGGERQRLELEEGEAPLDALGARAALADEIGEEGGIELTPLGGPHHVRPMREIRLAGVDRFRLAPGAGMVAVTRQEHAEGELPLVLRHMLSRVERAPAWCFGARDLVTRPLARSRTGWCRRRRRRHRAARACPSSTAARARPGRTAASRRAPWRGSGTARLPPAARSGR